MRLSINFFYLFLFNVNVNIVVMSGNHFFVFPLEYDFTFDVWCEYYHHSVVVDSMFL